jgi:hypothetical protein
VQDTGIFIQHLTNLSGCDSLIFTTTVLSAADLCSVQASVSVQQPKCYGDTAFIDLEVTVGLSPFNVDWKHAMLPLFGTSQIQATPGNASLQFFEPGRYYIEIKSANGLFFLDSVFIEDIPQLIISASAQLDAFGYGISCAGDATGEVMSTLQGPGTPPLTYIWSNGTTDSMLTGVTAGLYQVTVSDQYGCESSASVNVIEPAPMSYEIILKDIGCSGQTNGGITIFNAQGGVTPWLSCPEVARLAVEIEAIGRRLAARDDCY